MCFRCVSNVEVDFSIKKENQNSDCENSGEPLKKSGRIEN